MSDEIDAPDKEDSTPLDDPKGNKKKILIIIVAMAVLVLGGAGLYFSGMLDSVLGGEETAAGEEHAGAERPKHVPAITDISKGGGVFMPIPDMIVNLNTSDGSARYLRLKVQLELLDPLDQPEVEKMMPKVVDQFQTYLRELRPEDMRGSKGLYRLQMELLARVNTAVKPVVVKDVLFQEILIQ